MSLGLQFIHALVEGESTVPLRNVREEFFVRDEKEAFAFVRTHLKRHGVLPSVDTLEENGHDVMRSKEPADYYAEKLRERYVYTIIRSRSEKIAKSMRDKDVAGAMATIREIATIGGHVLEPDSFSSLQIEGAEILNDYYRIKEQGEPDYGILSGWPTLDRLTMGFQNGDLIAIAARPNVGKTWILLYLAYQAWCAGKSVGILSMEMTKKQMVRRFISFITRANPRLLREGSLSTWAEELLRGAVRGLRRRPPVWINSSDMKHRSTGLVEKLFAEHNPDIVYVDSAYRLIPQDSRYNMSTSDRNEQMVNELKQIAIHFDRPVVAVNQYNRSVKQRGQNQAADLGSAKGTDAWEQDSSIFLGVRMGAAPFETSSRIIDVTKNRDGALGEFRVNFGFSPLDFTELADDDQFSVASDSGYDE